MLNLFGIDYVCSFQPALGFMVLSIMNHVEVMILFCKIQDSGDKYSKFGLYDQINYIQDIDNAFYLFKTVN